MAHAHTWPRSKVSGDIDGSEYCKKHKEWVRVCLKTLGAAGRSASTTIDAPVLHNSILTMYRYYACVCYLPVLLINLTYVPL